MTENDEPGLHRVGKLDTLGAVRHEAARLYRRGLRGELPASDARALGTLLGLVAKIIEGGELEARMAAIEERLADRRGRAA